MTETLDVEAPIVPPPVVDATPVSAVPFELAIAEGIARLLATAGVVTLNGPGIPVHVQRLRDNKKTPTVVAVTTYSVTANTSSPIVTVGVQTRVRSREELPNVAAHTADGIFQALHQYEGVLETGITIISCSQRSTSILGVDSDGCWDQFLNFDVVCSRGTGRQVS